jgi:aminoglycoside phosphotransferase (APT) family kinase protein
LHEAQVLRALGEQSALHVPEVVAVSAYPVFLATRLVDGVPLSYDLLNAADRAQINEVGTELALFLSRLHQPENLGRVTSVAGPVRAPHPPPTTTDELRTRLTPMLRHHHADAVRRWCAWADEVLACRGDPVFVHGDLHGYNQVWDQRRQKLRLVWETSSAAEAEYDLRYIPALGPGVGLLTSTVQHYTQQTGRSLDLDHVMAWHVRTFLGEALWRSKAGLPLLLPIPGGGTPQDYVDQLNRRFDALHRTP